MNYASGMMMGLAMVQGASRLLGGGRGMGSGKGMGGGGFSPEDMLGNAVNFLSAQGKNNKAVQLPSAAVPKVFSLVSAQPGRRRYRATRLSPELADLLEEKLAKLDFIDSVKANPLSGSLLLLFAPEKTAEVDRLAVGLRDKVFGLAANSVNSSANSDEIGEAAAGSLTRAVRKSLSDLSGWIKDSSNGIFDMGSLASSLLLVRGLRKMILTGEYPSGTQMLWWAVSLMRGWRAA